MTDKVAIGPAAVALGHTVTVRSITVAAGVPYEATKHPAFLSQAIRLQSIAPWTELWLISKSNDFFAKRLILSLDPLEWRELEVYGDITSLPDHVGGLAVKWSEDDRWCVVVEADAALPPLAKNLATRSAACRKLAELTGEGGHLNAVAVAGELGVEAARKAGKAAVQNDARTEQVLAGR